MMGRTHWTQREDDIIRKHYPENGASHCAIYLKRRTTSSIHSRAKLLGIICQMKNTGGRRKASGSRKKVEIGELPEKYRREFVPLQWTPPPVYREGAEDFKKWPSLVTCLSTSQT